MNRTTLKHCAKQVGFAVAISFLLCGAASAQAMTSSSKSSAAMAKASPSKAAPLDINTASRTELMNLKGVGDKRADAIIAGRPFKGKDELVQKNILPKAVYDGIKADIIAKQK